MRFFILTLCVVLVVTVSYANSNAIDDLPNGLTPEDMQELNEFNEKIAKNIDNAEGPLKTALLRVDDAKTRSINNPFSTITTVHKDSNDNCVVVDTDVAGKIIVILTFDQTGKIIEADGVTLDDPLQLPTKVIEDLQGKCDRD